MEIVVDGRGFDSLVKGLTKLERELPRAIAQGLNEGGDKVRTQVQKSLQRQTGLVKYESVTSRVGTRRAFDGAPRSGIGPVAVGSLAYEIIVRGKPSTKPSEFKYSVKKGPGGGVTVWVWNVPHKFQRSFALFGKAAEGLRARTGETRFPIRSFDGPNLAKEAVEGETAETFEKGAATLVMPMIEKRIGRILG
jgi:hypothetical protein